MNTLTRARKIIAIIKMLMGANDRHLRIAYAFINSLTRPE